MVASGDKLLHIVVIAFDLERFLIVRPIPWIEHDLAMVVHKIAFFSVNEDIIDDIVRAEVDVVAEDPHWNPKKDERNHIQSVSNRLIQPGLVVVLEPVSSQTYWKGKSFDL